MPVILATQEAEIKKIAVQGQFKASSGKIVHKTPISKITSAKWTGGMAQVPQRA
jgi:hypothetical protein